MRRFPAFVCLALLVALPPAVAAQTTPEGGEVTGPAATVTDRDSSPPPAEAPAVPAPEAELPARFVLAFLEENLARNIPGDDACRAGGAASKPEGVPIWALDLQACLSALPRLYDIWQNQPERRRPSASVPWQGAVSDAALVDWLRRSLEASVPDAFACRASPLTTRVEGMPDWAGQAARCLGTISMVLAAKSAVPTAGTKEVTVVTDNTVLVTPPSTGTGPGDPVDTGTGTTGDTGTAESREKLEARLRQATETERLLRADLAARDRIVADLEQRVAMFQQRLDDLGVSLTATFAYLGDDPYGSALRPNEVARIKVAPPDRIIRIDDCSAALDWLYGQQEFVQRAIWAAANDRFVICERGADGTVVTRDEKTAVEEVHVVLVR